MRHSFLPLLLVLVGCAGRNGIADQGATVVSSASVYLRNTFDTDPSTYVGRFVPAGVTDLDESNTMILACSKHITTRFIEGGGVSFTEDLSVSTQVAARIGIPLIADASASHASSRSARAEYRLTGKIVAEIPDPDAFAACCKAQPDQCTDRFIGEFIQGTGSLLHEASKETKIDASGTNPSSGINGAGGLERSAGWKRLAEFPEPVYFAFKVNPTGYAKGACPKWADEVPTAEGGVYVVGRSDNSRSEQGARNDALGNANGVALQAAGLAGNSLGGAPMPLRAESWCVTTSKVRRSTRYAARVLAFVSNESIAEAKKTAEARAVAEREAARLAAEREEARLVAEREAARLAAEREAANPKPAPVTPVTPPATDPSPATPTPGIGAPAAASDGARLVAAVQAESFSADKLSALALASQGVRITAAEARQVLDVLDFSGDKMEALKLLRDKITDPQNWSVVVGGFNASVDREAARKLAP